MIGHNEDVVEGNTLDIEIDVRWEGTEPADSIQSKLYSTAPLADLEASLADSGNEKDDDVDPPTIRSSMPLP